MASLRHALLLPVPLLALLILSAPSRADSAACFGQKIGVEVDWGREAVTVRFPPRNPNATNCADFPEVVTISATARALSLSHEVANFSADADQSFSLPCPPHEAAECLEEFSDPYGILVSVSSDRGSEGGVDVAEAAGTVGARNYDYSNCFGNAHVRFSLESGKNTIRVQVEPYACRVPEEAQPNFHAWIRYESMQSGSIVELEVTPRDGADLEEGHFRLPHDHAHTKIYEVRCASLTPTAEDPDIQKRCEEQIREALQLDTAVSLRLESNFTTKGSPWSSADAASVKDAAAQSEVNMSLNIILPVVTLVSARYPNTFAPPSLIVFDEYMRLDYAVAEDQTYEPPDNLAKTIFSLLLSDSDDPSKATRSRFFTREAEVTTPTGEVRFGCEADDEPCLADYAFFRSLGTELRATMSIEFQDIEEMAIAFAVLYMERIDVTPWARAHAVVSRDGVCIWGIPISTAPPDHPIFTDQETSVGIDVMTNVGRSSLDISMFQYAYFEGTRGFKAGKRVCLSCSEMEPKDYDNGGKDCVSQLAAFKADHKSSKKGLVRFTIHGTAYPCTYIGFRDDTILYAVAFSLMFALALGFGIYVAVSISRMRTAVYLQQSAEAYGYGSEVAAEAV